MQAPTLYSFRRCPYAMRARVALAYAKVKVELREVLLSKKPEVLMQISPKATVPVLQVNETTLLDESLDIMLWALNKNDPNNWLKVDKAKAEELIQQNDTEFKTNLDLYKYADRFPEQSEQQYREQGEQFLKILETKLNRYSFLLSAKPSYVDIAIFPFVRQFAAVDKTWFENSPYIKTNKWLNYWLSSTYFKQAMEKHRPWKSSDKPIMLFT